MQQKTRMEREALEYAVGKSGEFIEKVEAGGSSTDMATWTPEVYAAYVEETVTAFVERMQQLKKAIDEDAAPF